MRQLINFPAWVRQLIIKQWLVAFSLNLQYYLLGLCGMLRAAVSRPRVHLPAVALTAYARPEDRMRALLAGYQMHVAKPIDPAELVLVVAGVVRTTPAH